MNIDRLLSDPAMAVLRQAIKASETTHETIANNIANVETPGFKTSEVIFKDKLAGALHDIQESSNNLEGARTNQAHFAINEEPSLEGVKPSVVVRAQTSLRPDGNNVDIDAEMTKLSQNTIMYQALTQLVSSKMNQLRTAISGR
jgi:flagellar basal-body rod protein FlgB